MSPAPPPPDSAPNPGSDGATRFRLMLWVGLVGGLALTLHSVLAGRPFEPAPADELGAAVATVNGAPISREALARLAATISRSDTDLEWTDDRMRRLLEGLIDEELLVQRAIELGLARKDELARRHLVQAMVDHAASRVEDETSDSDLRAYFKRHPNLFAREGRVRVGHVFVRANASDEPESLRRAREAAAALREGRPIEEVRQRWGDAPLMEIPTGPLRPDKLRDYVGPTAARAASELEPGDVTPPIRSVGGYHVLRVVAREPGSVPPFDEVRDAVRRRLVENRKAEAVRAYVDDLRARADIRLAPLSPGPP